MSLMAEPTVSSLPDLGHAFAVVDIETTGFSSSRDRIVQVAISLLDRSGNLEQHWVTLVDPECDPGPVHIHGITPERLIGAPTFQQVAPTIAGLLAGRVIVAHNASFDWRFLHAETSRAQVSITGGRRLCTLALARRLDLELPDLKLATLAWWAKVEQQQAHDASDDVRVLHSVFLKLMWHALRGAIPLPLVRNLDAQIAPRPTATAPRMESAFVLPGWWAPGTPLVQGMKFVITGATPTPREDLYAAGMRAGLVPMNGVSSRTRFVVSEDSILRTAKAGFARDHGVPVITEQTFLSLLADVAPGVPIGERPTPPVRDAEPLQPLRGSRVLVLGGRHVPAAVARERIAALGGRIAVNLTPTVSHVLVLSGAEDDRRTALTSGLIRLDPVTLLPLSAVAQSPAVPAALEATAVADATVLGRGWVSDLPAAVNRWQLFVTWTMDDPPPELDVVAFVTGADEKVLSDEHFVFYNQLRSPGGEVRLDLENAGESRVSFDLDELANPGVRLVVGATLGGGRTFGDLGPVEITLRDRFGRAWVRSVLDAGTSESSLVLAEFYQRGDAWRMRAVGQGYQEGLAAFAVRFGVDVSS